MPITVQPSAEHPAVVWVCSKMNRLGFCWHKMWPKVTATETEGSWWWWWVVRTVILPKRPAWCEPTFIILTNKTKQNTQYPAWTLTLFAACHTARTQTRLHECSRHSRATGRPLHTSQVHHTERRDNDTDTGRDSTHTKDERGVGVGGGWHCRACCLHFDQIPIFKFVVGVTLQRREVANTVIDWDAGGKCNA